MAHLSRSIQLRFSSFFVFPHTRSQESLQAVVENNSRREKARCWFGEDFYQAMGCFKPFKWRFPEIGVLYPQNWSVFGQTQLVKNHPQLFSGLRWSAVKIHRDDMLRGMQNEVLSMAGVPHSIDHLPYECLWILLFDGHFRAIPWCIPWCIPW